MITGYDVKVGGVIKARCEDEAAAIETMVAEANTLAQRNASYVLTRHGLYAIELGHVALKSRFDVRVSPIAACPCCGSKLFTYWQPAGEMPGYWAGTCLETTCLLISRTLPLEQFESEMRLAFQRDEARKRRQRDAQRRSRARRQAAQKATE